MDSPHSVNSNAVDAASVSTQIDKLVKSFDSAIKLAKILGEKKGAGEFKSGEKKVIVNGEKKGFDDLNSWVSSIKNELKEIPKIVNRQKKAERDAKKSKHANRENKVQRPNLYKAELVSFFTNADLGKAADGVRRLQDHPDMALFFKNGVCSLTFGVSLFNVWGNIYKLKHKSDNIVLDDRSVAALRGALTKLKADKMAIINSADASEGEKKLAREVVERLERNTIHNKDYMSILSFFRDKDNTQDLSSLTEQVSRMLEVTKSLNAGYKSELEAFRESTKTSSLMSKVNAAVPQPALPTLKAVTALPTVVPTTTAARGASPTGRRK